jgi:hypothetical protein
VTAAPRWLREQRRRDSIAVSLEDLHREVDRLWLDVFQVVRHLGLRSVIERSEPRPPVEPPAGLRLVPGGGGSRDR